MARAAAAAALYYESLQRPSQHGTAARADALCPLMTSTPCLHSPRSQTAGELTASERESVLEQFAQKLQDCETQIAEANKEGASREERESTSV